MGLRLGVLGFGRIRPAIRYHQPFERRSRNQNKSCCFWLQSWGRYRTQAVGNFWFLQFQAPGQAATTAEALQEARNWNQVLIILKLSLPPAPSLSLYICRI